MHFKYSQLDASGGDYDHDAWLYHLTAIDSKRMEVYPVIQGPVVIPPYAQEITWTVYAVRTAGLTASMYAALDSPSQENAVTSGEKVAIGTSAGRFSGTVPVPPEAANRGAAIFSLYVDTEISATAEYGSNQAVNDAGSNWVEIADSAASVYNKGYYDRGYVIVIKDSGGTDRADILPRTIINEVHYSTNGYRRFYVDAPWTEEILIGDDLMNIYPFSELLVRSGSVWVSAITTSR
jgi:hypothetical protein